MKTNTIIKKVVRIVLWCYIAAFLLALLHFGRRILVAERFVIPSASMSPTLNPGDRVWVNKLLFGPRIYTSLDFSRGEPLKSFRLPGIRKIRPGDIVIFNFPLGYNDWSRIEFRINYVYCKRVAGCPGDVISIVEGVPHNANYDRTIGITEKQAELMAIDDGELDRSLRLNSIPLSLPEWNVRNLGPLTVPVRGWSVAMTPFKAELYRLAIEYETGQKLYVNSDGMVFLDGQPLEEYTFSSDWYFVLGDNSADSQDSRYWGFLPEEFIVGIVAARK